MFVILNSMIINLINETDASVAKIKKILVYKENILGINTQKMTAIRDSNIPTEITKNSCPSIFSFKICSFIFDTDVAKTDHTVAYIPIAIAKQLTIPEQRLSEK